MDGGGDGHGGAVRTRYSVTSGKAGGHSEQATFQTRDGVAVESGKAADEEYEENDRLVPMPRSGIQIHTPHVRIPERLVQHDAFLGGVRIWYPV